MLQKELALIVNEEVYVKDALITITYIECAPDLHDATIGISVLPENLAGSALSGLKASSKLISGILRKKTRIKRI